MSDWRDATPARVYLFGLKWGVVVLLTVLVVTAGTVVAVFGFKVLTAEPKGRGEAHIQIQSAANRIAAYQHFFNLCVAVQASEAQIDALNDELEQYPEAGKDRARTLANLTGVRASRQRSIAQYNADARKDYTIGQFRDSDLPYELSEADYPEGGKTSCESH